MLFTPLIFATSALLASAAPAAPTIDLTVLNFALTLEYLESTYYNQFLAAYDQSAFEKEGLGQARSGIKLIAAHEAGHVKFLGDAITAAGGKPVGSCEFKFPNSTVKAGLQFASGLEKVGVSAYTGAIGLIETKAFVTAGATIATVEARHAAALNVLNSYEPYPTVFDTPLGIRSIVSLITPVVVSCPFELPGKAFESALTIAGTQASIGSSIDVTFKTSASTSGLFCNFKSGLTSFRSALTDISSDNGSISAKCCIPKGLNGNQATIAFIVNSDADVTPVDESHVIAGPAFLDLKAE